MLLLPSSTRLYECPLRKHGLSPLRIVRQDVPPTSVTLTQLVATSAMDVRGQPLASILRSSGVRTTDRTRSVWLVDIVTPTY